MQHGKRTASLYQSTKLRDNTCGQPIGVTQFAATTGKGKGPSNIAGLLRQPPELELDLVPVVTIRATRPQDDLLSVRSRIASSSAFVFDDISHLLHPNLHQVWSSASQDLPFRSRP
jgi:hypothetical protein